MSTRKVLIAEDNNFNAKLLQKLLLQGGYDVELTYDGEQALEAARRETFHVVLTDWMMPKMDGISLIRRIREEVDPIPLVIVVTSLNSEEARGHALNSGADDYLAKPYKHAEVVPLVDELFARRYGGEVKTEGPEVRQAKQEAPFAGVCLVANTGGPPTLTKLIPHLPSTTDAAYFLAQHSPKWVSDDLWKRLQSLTSMRVNLAQDNMPVFSREIYVAPGDQHILVEPDPLRIKLVPRKPDHLVCPAGDPLMISVASSFGKKSAGVVLTGIGNDCVVGSSHIYAAGGTVIVQEPRTSLAQDMPVKVLEANPDALRVGLSSIPEALNAHFQVVLNDG